MGLNSVLKEKLKILQGEKGEIKLSGLKILGCSKTYQITNGFCKTKNLNALKNVNFFVFKNKITIDLFKCSNWRIIYNSWT